MGVHYVCPVCRTKMKSPTRFVGKRATCPGCKADLIVPPGRSLPPASKDSDRLKPSQPPSQIETGDYDEDAEAIRRELDPDEPLD